MDFLRFLLRLPLLILRGFYWIVSKIVGDVSWSAPRWMRATGSGIAYTGRGMRAHPGRSSVIVILLAAFIGGGIWTYHWYENRPRPIEEVPVTMIVAPPPVTDYSQDKIEVHPLVIAFSRSAAPLALVGKAVTTGIRMTPETAGTWTWVNDRSLEFRPKEDWAVGQDFDVRFDPKVAFAEHVKVQKDALQFRSADFTTRLVNAEFYQDPLDATAKKAIVSFAFNHPVDTVSFEKNVSVVLENAPKKPVKATKKRGEQIAATQPQDSQLAGFGKKKFIVTYDERKLSAFVHSEPLTIPKDDAMVVVTVDKGVRAARGGPPIADAIQGSARVPGLYSLQVDSVAPTLVDNANFEPEQVLVVETSQAVSEKDATKAVTAWLLPEFNPKTPEDQRTEPYNWGLGEVGEDLLKQSQKLSLEAVPTEREFEALHSFKFHADPKRYLYVRVEKNLRSFGGYVLGSNSPSVVQIPEYPRMLKFMADGALLSLNGEKRVSVVARNVPGMELEIGRVLPNQLQHVVGFNHGTYAKPSLEPLTADQITERFVQKIPFPQDDPQKAHFEGVNLGQYLDKGGAARHGVFLLKLSKLKPEEKPKADDPQADGTDEPSDEGGDAGDEGEGMDGADNNDDDGTPLGDSRLIVITDLGVIAKKSLDGSQDVFVQSIKTGSPVGDVVVDVVGRNGQTLMTQNTPADGHVHFDTLAAFTREKAPAMYVVRKGDDESFLPIGENDRNLDFSRFDIGGERNAKNANKLSAYLFSDRGIYRPGDTFHVGLIVRAASWASPLSGIPLQADITDARGIVVESRKLRLSTSGFEELSYTTQESAPTGGWNVNLYIVKDGKTDAQIGSVGLQVKEFMPDRMKADARLSQNVADGWIKPDNLKVLFTLQNLFGTPAQNRRVEATLSLQPYFPSFHNYPGLQILRSEPREGRLLRTARRSHHRRKRRGGISARLEQVRHVVVSVAFLRQRL